MFAHNIRGRWWCDSKGWTLPPIFCSTLLRDGWKQKSCLRKCHLTLKCVWSRGAELNSFMWEKMAPIDILWHLLNMYGDQKVDVSTVRAGWCISAVATVTWKSLKSCSRQPCAAITPQVKSISYQLICMNQWIPTRGLCTELNTSVKLQCIGNSGDNVRISQFMPGWSHECWRRNWKNTICEFVRTYWTNARLMVTVPWIT